MPLVLTFDAMDRELRRTLPLLNGHDLLGELQIDSSGGVFASSCSRSGPWEQILLGAIDFMARKALLRSIASSIEQVSLGSSVSLLQLLHSLSFVPLRFWIVLEVDNRVSDYINGVNG